MARHSTRADWESFWKRDRSVEEIYPASDSILENLFAVTDVRGMRILEVGAGTGRNSIKLSEKGAHLTVLDYAENALNKVSQALENSDTSVNLVRGDGAVLPFEDESFDIVFHQGLLEHFHDPQPLLRENVRVLKKGGYLLIDVPQKYHVYTIIKHILIRVNKWFAGWETEFTIGGLRRLYSDNHLTITREYGDWMVPSLFYRILRESFKLIGITLPMYPKSISLLGKLRKACKSFLVKQPLSMYTFITIGIIGKKE